MDFELLFPSEYLKAVDLRGQEVVAVIEKVYVDELRGTEGQRKKKLLIRFKGKDKKLVCNITNARAIAEVWGREVDDWPGKPIILRAQRVEGFGKMVDAIRVKPERPQQRAAKQNGNGQPQRAPAPAAPPAPAPPAEEPTGKSSLELLEEQERAEAGAGDDDQDDQRGDAWEGEGE